MTIMSRRHTLAADPDQQQVMVAIDVGATNIKIVPAAVADSGITLLEVSSIPDLPLTQNGTEIVDVGSMIDALQERLQELADRYQVLSIGIDTYGNGYGVVDAQGAVVQYPYYYRDHRIDGIWDTVSRFYTQDELYRLFGNFPIKTRGLFHLYRDVLDHNPNIRNGNTIVPLPNLLEYLLTGRIGSERTIASVLYMLDADGQEWNRQVFRTLGIPEEIFPQLTDAGNYLGTIQQWDHTQASAPRVIRVLGHDTESALITAPEMGEDDVFVSLGTSFIFGTRVHHPMINDATYQYRFKNMRGDGEWYSLCKDFPGFWVLERCINQWDRLYNGVTYDFLCKEAAQAEENHTYLDLNADRFRVSESNILEVIRQYCNDTNQSYPDSVGAMTKCIFESYCLYIRWNTDRLGQITGRRFNRLYAFNGGVRNHDLMQMMADCTGMDVCAQSPYASAVGNLMVQYRTVFGTEGCLAEKERVYVPRPHTNWDDKYTEYIDRNILEEERNGQ